MAFDSVPKGDELSEIKRRIENIGTIVAVEMKKVQWTFDSEAENKYKKACHPAYKLPVDLGEEMKFGRME